MRADNLLRTARRQARITQRELSSRTGVPQSTIARVERGQTDPRATTLSALLVGCGQTLTSSGLTGIKSLAMSSRANRYLPEITWRLAAGFRPSRIVLFGSQVDGRATETSDVDLLVVVPEAASKRDVRVAMRRALSDLPIDKDILVMTEAEATNARGWSIAATALRDGVTIYGA